MFGQVGRIGRGQYRHYEWGPRGMPTSPVARRRCPAAPSLIPGRQLCGGSITEGARRQWWSRSTAAVPCDGPAMPFAIIVPPACARPDRNATGAVAIIPIGAPCPTMPSLAVVTTLAGSIGGPATAGASCNPTAAAAPCVHGSRCRDEEQSRSDCSNNGSVHGCLHRTLCWSR
jgi:hypothetical protein